MMLAEAVENRLVTAEELLREMPEARRGELVKGEFIKMSPAGYQHGKIAGNIFGSLWNFVRQNRLGYVYAAETGFLLSRNPDTVRAPDAAFVTTERAARQARERGFFDGPPDLAVEVISPTETVEEVEAKLIDYLEAGARLVWLIYPRTQTITVYRSLTDVDILTAADTLDGGELLPGFVTAVSEIFA